MKANTRSATALAVAMARAAHQVIDDNPVMSDPIALPILGLPWSLGVNAMNPLYGTRIARRLRAFVVGRARYAEDELAGAVKERGVRQYAILGAGFDTFAYRNPFEALGLQVFEIDHPATQAWKRERLADAGIHVPDSLRYASIDFETQRLFDVLAASGFDAAAPAQLSWMGVSMYLEPQKVRDTLAEIARTLPSGSTLVMDYLTPIPEQPSVHKATLTTMSSSVALIGEPWKSFFEPGELAGEHQALGFSGALDLSPEAINEKYFAARTDGVSVGRLGHLLRLQV